METQAERLKRRVEELRAAGYYSTLGQGHGPSESLGGMKARATREPRSADDDIANGEPVTEGPTGIAGFLSGRYS